MLFVPEPVFSYCWTESAANTAELLVPIFLIRSDALIAAMTDRFTFPMGLIGANKKESKSGK